MGRGRIVAVAWLLLLGCGAADRPEPEAEPGEAAYARWPEAIAELPLAEGHTEVVCEREGDDALRDVMCGEAPASITGLRDLYEALGIDLTQIPSGLVGLSVTGHSTSLSTRSVSALNPRVLTVRLETSLSELLAIGFVRGEQLVELVVRDRGDGELRFYLLAFEQACNAREGGCSAGELLTPAIEQDWEAVTLYDERDVANTTLDCAPCHQPLGPGTPKLLRMQERQEPWTHWFFLSSEGGAALLSDYTRAKGDEQLAGYTAEQIRNSHPGNLAMLADFAGSLEPNPFDSVAIEDSGLGGDSEAWQAAYARARQGDAIAVPYPEVRVTDPDKLEAHTLAYQRYRAGELEARALPDLRDIFPDDPGELARMGVATEPDMDGEQVLLQACGQCHNDRLDQNLSRANFRADLSGMGREQKDAAIARLRLPDDNPRAMPPHRLRVLTEAARERAIETLSR